MAIRKGNVMLQVSVPQEVVDSMNVITTAMSEKLKRRITKGILITDIYIQWLEFQGRKLEETLEREVKE